MVTLNFGCIRACPQRQQNKKEKKRWKGREFWPSVGCQDQAGYRDQERAGKDIMVPVLPVKGEVTTRSTHELGAVPKARAETHGRCRLGLGCWLCAHTHLRYPASPQLGGGSVAHCSLCLHHQVPSQEGDKVWCDDSMDQRNDCFSRRPKINCQYIHGS